MITEGTLNTSSLAHAGRLLPELDWYLLHGEGPDDAHAALEYIYGGGVDGAALLDLVDEGHGAAVADGHRGAALLALLHAPEVNVRLRAHWYGITGGGVGWGSEWDGLVMG